MIHDHAAFRESLHAMAREHASLARPMPNGWVQCVACGHRCKIAPEHDGICKVRWNRGGKLFVPSNYVCGVQLDPVEKKPFFHVYPGSTALSYGMLGCDYHCGYCQNWISSQTLRDANASALPTETTAEDLVQAALDHGARIITSTYNEPLITSEWSRSIFMLAKEKGLVTSYVSNGNATPEVLDYLEPYLDLCKVDLKSFRQRNYAQLGGRLQTVLETIADVYRRGIWIEVVTLVIPGFNDSEEELREMAQFIRSVCAEIPWHVTAFHQDYKMTSPQNTPMQSLVRAVDIGREEGLHYVYAGNVRGRAGTTEDTTCRTCGKTIVKRRGFMVISNEIVNGQCAFCSTPVPGRWD
ncbi:MAG TPA: AmmeMemoRadiSam system radical SAM enzyme [Bacteroidota bacterium]|nr:AmmeMemoRadiSam system radical SAM enzyme [Bacteroidota bacterium]